jgi:hypothetical protein
MGSKKLVAVRILDNESVSLRSLLQLFFEGIKEMASYPREHNLVVEDTGVHAPDLVFFSLIP